MVEQEMSEEEKAREYTRSRLAGVNRAFGDVKSGNVATGRYSSTGATSYQKGIGYTRPTAINGKQAKEVIAPDNQFVEKPKTQQKAQPPQVIRQTPQERVQDIDAQLSSGLVRAEVRETLLAERRALAGNKQVQQTRRPTQEFSYGDDLSKLKQATVVNVGKTNKPEDTNFFNKAMEFANKVITYEDPAITKARMEGKAVEASAPGFVSLAGGKGAVGKVANFAKTNTVRRFFANVGILSAETAAITQGTKQVSQATAPKSQKDLIKKLVQEKNINPNQIFGQAIKEEEGKILQRNQGINFAGKELPAAVDLGFVTLSTRGLVRDLPGGTLLTQDKKTFDSSVRRQAKELGLNKTDTETLVKWANREKKFRAGGEVAGALNIERGAEKIGRDLITDAFIKKTGTIVAKNKAARTLFTTVGARTAAAGAFEGAAGEFFQRSSREQEQNFKAIIGAGAAGTAFAGVAGGTLAARTVKGKGKVLNVALNIIDPLEKPGDIIQDTIERTQERIFKKPTLQPSFRKNQVGHIVLGTSVRSFTPGDFIQRINTPSETKKKTQPKIISFDQLVNEYEKKFDNVINLQGKTNMPTDSITTTKSKTDIPPTTVSNIQNIQEDYYQKTQQQANSFTNSFIFSDTPTKVPTTTPFPRILPPVPPGLPLGAGGLGSRVGKRTKFINEAGLALAFFAGNTKQAQRLLKPTAKRKSKKNKKTKRKKK